MTPTAWRQRLLSSGGILLLLLILVLVNVLLSGVNLRLDATSERLYSLSPGSRQILQTLNEPVTIKLFFSRQGVAMPEHLKIYGQRVLDFLEEYRHAARGRIRLEVLDPRPDSDEQDWAQKYGVQGMSLPSGENVFLGLVALAADQEAAIAFLDPSRETQLEYDITRTLARVMSPLRKKIGVLSSLPIFGMNPMMLGMPSPSQEMPPWMVVQELRKTYDLVELNPAGESLEPGLDLVMLVQPEALPEPLLYAIDQYVLGGGKLLLFIDPLATMAPPRGPSTGPAALAKLLAAWGLSLEADKAVADFGFATRLRNAAGQVENNPFWLSLQSTAFNHESIISAELETMLLPVAGALQVLPDSGLQATRLLQSSAQASLQPSMLARGALESLRREFKPAGAAQDLAVLMRGRFKSAFPAGAPQGQQAAPQPARTHLAEAHTEGTVLVVADADLLYDAYYVDQQSFLGMNISRFFNDNLNFVLNATELLTGSEALISLRSRGRFERPFTRVQALESVAQTRWLEREQELLRKVEETNRKINHLQTQKDASQKLVLSPEQEAEIKRFRDEKIRINQQLKEVRRNLRADIEALGTRLKLINLLLVPALVALGGLLYAWRRRRRQRAPWDAAQQGAQP